MNRNVKSILVIRLQHCGFSAHGYNTSEF